MGHQQLEREFARLLASMIENLGVDRARREFKDAVKSVGLDPDDFELELLESQNVRR